MKMTKPLISILCEGSMEWELITNIKTKIIDCKYIRFCKSHSKKDPSCIDNVDKFYNDSSCCITMFIVFDKDKRDDNTINKLKETYNRTQIIVTYPYLELVLLNIFKSTTSREFTTRELHDELNKELKKINPSHEYKHSPSMIDIFIKLLNKKEIYSTWKDNLKKLKEHNKFNFIDLIDFLEESKKGK